MDALFDDSTLHEIRLTTHPSDWQRLRNNVQSNTYYPANLEWRGITIEEVGIRSRGLGSRSAAKPGLRIDFDRFVANRQFLGLRSLVLDNLTQDQAMMKERISMKLFVRMGIPAPRVAHARLIVNGAYAGLYTIVEPVDKGFLKRNFGEDGGYLYDYEWATDYWFEYLGDNPAAYSPSPFELQTNESSPNPRPLIEMIRVINQSPDENFVEAVSRHLDPKQFLTYLAVEAFLAEVDGIAGEWGMNNFYLYGLQSTGRFVFVPWDKDVAFHDVNRSVWENTERNVLTRRLLAVPEFRVYFVEQLRRCGEISGGPGGWLEQEIEIQYLQIHRAAVDDPNKPFTYAQFEESVTILRLFAFERGGAVAYSIEEAAAGR